jgi:hypothetical protein
MVDLLVKDIAQLTFCTQLDEFSEHFTQKLYGKSV